MARRALKVLAGLLAVGFVALVVMTWYLKNNITTIDLDRLTNRPDRASSAPVNILVMGSDSREGAGNAGYGRFDGARSDTTLLVHIAGDRKSALVVSIPRDSMVEFTGCPNGDGGTGLSSHDASVAPSSEVGTNGEPTLRYHRQMFNEAFNIGGPTCTLAQVEHNTRIYIDHFAVVDFAGFKSMVDALGGVPVCVPQAIKDEDSKLDIPAGTSTLNGEQALAFVRTRKSIGDGSDLGRIKIQQAFLGAMVREATSSQLLLRPDRLVRFLDAATKSLTTDPDLGSVTNLTDLAAQVKGLPPQSIRFITVPVEGYPADRNRVQWAPAADDLWTAIREDRSLEPQPTPSDSATTSTSGLLPPEEVRVRVVNRSGVAGLGGQATKALAAQGFSMAAAGSGPVADAPDTVRVTYPEGLSEEAATVAAAFPGAVVEIDHTATGNAVTVELGKNAPAVVKVPTASASASVPSQPISPSPSSSRPFAASNTAEDTLCG